MTDPTEPLDASRPQDDDGATRRRRLLVAGAAVLVAAAVVVALVVRGTDDGSSTDDPAGAGSSVATPDPTASGGDAADEGAAPVPDASEGPTGAAEDPTAREQPPVALDASPTVTDGITLRVESLSATDAAAALPGEVAGPGVSVTLVLDNDGGRPFDLSTTVVNLYSGPDGTPANAVSTGTSAFPSEAPAGTATTATYVFAVPADERDQVRVTVDAAVDLPTVVFEGAAS